MKIAFLVHAEVPDGTHIDEVRKAVQLEVCIDLDHEDSGSQLLESVTVDANSAKAYDPEHGGVFVYQP